MMSFSLFIFVLLPLLELSHLPLNRLCWRRCAKDGSRSAPMLDNGDWYRFGVTPRRLGGESESTSQSEGRILTCSLDRKIRFRATAASTASVSMPAIIKKSKISFIGIMSAVKLMLMRRFSIAHSSRP
jgi:hypothetical protein